MTIIHERTQDENLTYESLVTRCEFIDLDASPRRFSGVLDRAATSLASRMALGPDKLLGALAETGTGQRLGEGVRIWYRTMEGVEKPELVVFRFRDGLALNDEEDHAADFDEVHSLIFLVSPRSIAGLDLRLAGHLAEIIQGDAFRRQWLTAESDRELRDILVRDDHFLHAPIEDIPYLSGYVDCELREVRFPGSCLVALIERDGELVPAKGNQTLRASDELAIIGEPEGLDILRRERPADG